MRSPSSSSGSSAQRSSVGSGNNVNRGRTSVGCAYTMREQEGCSSAVARTRTTSSISACAFRGWSFVTLPAAHADALRPQPQEQVTSQRAPPALISWTSSGDVVKTVISGLGATVTILMYYNGTLIFTFTDSDAKRIIGASSGMGFGFDNENNGFSETAISSFTADDGFALASGPTVILLGQGAM